MTETLFDEFMKLEHYFQMTEFHYCLEVFYNTVRHFCLWNRSKIDSWPAAKLCFEYVQLEGMFNCLYEVLILTVSKPTYNCISQLTLEECVTDAVARVEILLAKVPPFSVETILSDIHQRSSCIYLI